VAASGSKGRYKLVASGGQVLRVSRIAEGHWKIEDRGATFSAEVAGSQVTLKEGTTTFLAGSFKGNKLRLEGTGGSWLLKMRPEKTKFGKSAEATPLEFKIKPSKIKVVLKSEEVGGVKFYPETGKLKVKTSDGIEVATLKAFGKLSAAPGAFLAEKGGFLSWKERDLLMATLLALGK
jgi:hypothetical protein